MVERLGGIVAGCAFLIELDELKGREAIGDYDYKVLMHYWDIIESSISFHYNKIRK